MLLLLLFSGQSCYWPTLSSFCSSWIDYVPSPLLSVPGWRQNKKKNNNIPVYSYSNSTNMCTKQWANRGELDLILLLKKVNTSSKQTTEKQAKGLAVEYRSVMPSKRGTMTYGKTVSE